MKLSQTRGYFLNQTSTHEITHQKTDRLKMSCYLLKSLTLLAHRKTGEILNQW